MKGSDYPKQIDIDRQVRDIEDRRRAWEDEEAEAFLGGAVPRDRANRDESEGSSDHGGDFSYEVHVLRTVVLVGEETSSPLDGPGDPRTMTRNLLPWMWVS